VLLILDDTGDTLHAFQHFRISGAHQLGDEAGELV
jgi:hypothetical protein